MRVRVSLTLATLLACAGCSGRAASPPASAPTVKPLASSEDASPAQSGSATATAPTPMSVEAGALDGDAGDAGTTAEPVRKALLRVQAEIDAQPGAEEIVLYDDRSLLAGAAQGTADLTGADAFWMREQAALRVVTLRPDLRAVLLVLPIAEDEDPPNRFQLFVARGTRLERVLDITPGFATVSRLLFPGDGTVRYREDKNQVCTYENPRPHTQRLHEVIYEHRDGRMKGPLRRETRDSVRCAREELIACPFVYLGSERAFAGEILRNVVGRAEQRLQGLRLALRADDAEATLRQGDQRSLRIVLSEEKPEQTFLDEVFLRVADQRVEPTRCLGADRPAFCQQDDRVWTLGRGEQLALDFAVPAGESDLVLFARGYYEPETTP